MTVQDRGFPEAALVVDGGALPWVNGAAAAATMVPAFRDHLGPADAVERMLQKYWVRPLLIDPRTTRRIDHVRCDPGYVDATSAFHRSVEECLVLKGSLHLDGEGDLRAGEYFWRPPGFVHSAASVDGFEALLMMEGDSPGDESSVVTREVRDGHEAGANALHPDDWERAIGPRGWPRRVSTQLLAAGPAPDSIFGDGSRARCLSFNPWTGAGSYLVRVPAGDEPFTPPSIDRERIIVVLQGRLELDRRPGLGPMSLLRLPAGAPSPELVTATALELFVKLGADVGACLPNQS